MENDYENEYSPNFEEGFLVSSDWVEPDYWA